MSRYNTKQREILLAFLNHHVHEFLSAHEIADGLKHEQISISAVYRNLADLEKEGKIRKHTQSGSRKVAYQYVDADSCQGRVHLSCKSCGKTFHLEDELTAQMICHFKDSMNFTVNPADTIIYGICNHCKQI